MSHYFLEVRLAKQLGPSLDRWKIKKDSPFHGNARCPVCGDSAKNKAKTRFHIIERDSKLFVHCFNCDLSTSLVTFLKGHYPTLYDEYIFERFGDRIKEPTIKVQDPDFKISRPTPPPNDKVTLDLPYIKDLPDDHPAKKYVKSRMLPDYPFQLAPRFFELVSKYNPDVQHEPGKKDEMRLIIPFFDKNGNVHAFQGRDLSGKSNQKYITTIVNAKIPKIFGICQLDVKHRIQLVEGPIDSLFLDNCIASVNASLSSTADKVCLINKNLKDRITLIFDNEPRNVSVLKHYKKAIDAGYHVVIWPENIKCKDINDMVMAGIDPQKIIDRNTFRGISAEIEFNKWRKVNV